ncbi:hypothetical protein KL948_004421 [Ogataea haglerorum]|uniref:Uncharacterized protein n=1 Tax=Ogataea haglerorum TaxID=1937702 RepID=A0ABQ7RBQ0_9ASCO|nr:hypothetical protein KL914_004686 [Ogataea haglerorum]KAG7703851.1 hypothetical protein KL950_004648 [Ogataea haglerorum]KAG7727894.1 hypothetical protein KL948_004421 [Ogataea haglerorum]KAG7735594.1 hypothetical protein KL932_004258 [Ogataea haglerorum]KAG7762574.1 hypothetical protein KL931_005286 [Ogataea haglerorum]
MFGRSRSRRALRKSRENASSPEIGSSSSIRGDPESAASVCTSITSNLKQLDLAAKETVRAAPLSAYQGAAADERQEMDELFAMEDELLAIVRAFQNTSLVRKKMLESLITNSFGVFRCSTAHATSIEMLERMQNTVNSLISFVMLLNQSDQPQDEFDDMNPYYARVHAPPHARANDMRFASMRAPRHLYEAYYPMTPYR